MTLPEMTFWIWVTVASGIGTFVLLAELVTWIAGRMGRGDDETP